MTNDTLRRHFPIHICKCTRPAHWSRHGTGTGWKNIVIVPEKQSSENTHRKGSALVYLYHLSSPQSISLSPSWHFPSRVFLQIPARRSKNKLNAAQDEKCEIKDVLAEIINSMLKAKGGIDDFKKVTSTTPAKCV